MYTQFTRSCLVLFLCTAFSASLFAQSINGAIRTASGEPAEFASLKLLRSSDSAVVAGTAAAANGAFSFQNVRPGDYYIQGGLIGYADVYAPVIVASIDDQIKLEPLTLTSATALKEAP